MNPGATRVPEGAIGHRTNRWGMIFGSYPQPTHNPIITPSCTDAGLDHCHTPSNTLTGPGAPYQRPTVSSCCLGAGRAAQKSSVSPSWIPSSSTRSGQSWAVMSQNLHSCADGTFHAVASDASRRIRPPSLSTNRSSTQAESGRPTCESGYATWPRNSTPRTPALWGRRTGRWRLGRRGPGRAFRSWRR